MSTTQGDSPPPYIMTSHNEADELLQPVILTLSENFIRAQSANDTPLYELSRDIGRSSGGEAQVSLGRLIHRVRTNVDGTPRVTHRNRRIFELKHLPPVLSKGFPYCLDAVSQASIGNLALKTTHFPRPGFKVVRIKPEKEGGFPKGYRARRKSLKEVELVFEILKKQGHYEWISPDGNRIAVEEETEDRYRLIVTAPVTRKMMDAMIGSWCLRIWRDSVELNHGSRNKIRSEVRSTREVLPRWW
ncbi:hypothetical protein F4779DRAFT_16161 [Xylariaceae sp. FL0662B]|nr:hypothetical protein F4779DRAFT_16161 [Xylariaceae sp. FL0662B]